MSRTTDKYVKIKKQNDTAPENELRIRAIPQIGRYISYAATLLLQKKLDTVLIKASGNAAKSAVQIAEILRHRIQGLHQLTTLKTISVIDEYEPREEGLDRVVIERKLAVLEITLSLKAEALDTKNPGYQVPLPKEEVQEENLETILGGRRGGDRGDRGEEGGYRPRRGGRGDGRRGGRYAGPRGGRRGGRGDRRGGDREEGRGYDDNRERGYGGRNYEDRERGYGGRGGRGYGGRGGSRGGRRYDDREERGGRNYEDNRERGYGGRNYDDNRERGYGGRNYEDRERGYGGRGGRGYGGRGGNRGGRRD